MSQQIHMRHRNRYFHICGISVSQRYIVGFRHMCWGCFGVLCCSAVSGSVLHFFCPSSPARISPAWPSRLSFFLSPSTMATANRCLLSSVRSRIITRTSILHSMVHNTPQYAAFAFRPCELSIHNSPITPARAAASPRFLQSILTTFFSFSLLTFSS
jgi:hypothetical protein